MKLLAIIVCVLLLGYVFACQSEASHSDTKDGVSYLLGPKPFKEKLAQASNAQLVDVRTPEEYKAGHLENSVNIDYHDNLFQAKMSKLNPDAPVFLYCKSGGRSGKSYNKLKKMGFKEVYDMKGGYTQWVKDFPQ